MAIETIISIVGAVGGTTAIIEIARFILTRKQSQQQASAAAYQATAEAEDKWFEKYEHQLDRMNTQIEFKDRRIEDLNEELDAKEKRFIEQTKRLRECQDREYQAQREIIKLTQKVGDLELERQRHKCIKENCPYKEPATELTHKARSLKNIKPLKTELPPEDPQPELTQI